METNMKNPHNKRRKTQHKMNGRIQVLALANIKTLMLLEMYLMQLLIIGENKTKVFLILIGKR